MTGGRAPVAGEACRLSGMCIKALAEEAKRGGPGIAHAAGVGAEDSDVQRALGLPGEPGTDKNVPFNGHPK